MNPDEIASALAALEHRGVIHSYSPGYVGRPKWKVTLMSDDELSNEKGITVEFTVKELNAFIMGTQAARR